MATPAQILANKANAQKSHGAVSETGRQISAQNRTIHGLARHNGPFRLLAYENQSAFDAFRNSLMKEHQPTNEIEGILVNNMVEAHWLANRAGNLANICLDLANGIIIDQKLFALYLRYESMHRRAFHKSLQELAKLRNEKAKAEIGFEAQKLKQAAAGRADQALDLKKQIFEFQKEAAGTKKNRPQADPVAQTDAESEPETHKMSA